MRFQYKLITYYLIIVSKVADNFMYGVGLRVLNIVMQSKAIICTNK